MASKLWLIQQTYNGGWDTFDSAVVVAETERAAKLIHPYGEDYVFRDGAWCCGEGYLYREDNTWAPPEHVTATEIGTAKEGESGVILASFKSG